MKLIFDLDTQNRAAFDAAGGKDEKILYCIPFEYEDAETVSLRAEEPELLDRAMQYIGRHMAEKITLEDLAKHLYVSESTVSQTFRKKMGVSFYRCVTQQRLVAAKAMIQEGPPLEDVSRRVGFADYSGFYRAFRQEYGISPRQFKKQDQLLATVNG